jgi:quercetin dioxygenase-like cupin family protein
MELINWDSVPLEVLSDTFSRKIVTGEKAMLAQIFIKKGGRVPEHQHESEQASYVLEGSLKFELEGKQVVVHKGEVLLIPSHVPHSAVALEDALSLDVFSPIRQDWLAKDDAYLRGRETEAVPPGPRL